MSTHTHQRIIKAIDEYKQKILYIIETHDSRRGEKRKQKLLYFPLQLILLFEVEFFFSFFFLNPFRYIRQLSPGIKIN